MQQEGRILQRKRLHLIHSVSECTQYRMGSRVNDVSSYRAEVNLKTFSYRGNKRNSSTSRVCHAFTHCQVVKGFFCCFLKLSPFKASSRDVVVDFASIFSTVQQYLFKRFDVSRLSAWRFTGFGEFWVTEVSFGEKSVLLVQNHDC